VALSPTCADALPSQAVRRRADCVQLVDSLEKAQRVVDELRAMPIEGAPLDAFSSGLSIR
jgi:hypothetical protein